MQDLFKDFPNLHPLFVHFPIVLLLLAATAQIAVLFFKNNPQLKWLSFTMAVLATIGAYIAFMTGPHISGEADDLAIPVFETHRKLANITLYLSLSATIIRLVALKWYRRQWMEYLLVLLFTTSAVLVAATAHHGAQLVYVYGVGPKGNAVLSE